jgi:amino acid adenylation domain-containing protein
VTAGSGSRRELLERLRRGETALPRERSASAQSGGALAPVQEPFWVEEQRTGPSSAQTIAIAYRIDGALDEDALERSLAAVVARHDSLRTRIVARDGVAVRELSGAGAALRRVTASGAEAGALLHAFANEPFALDAGPPCRFLLIAETPLRHVFAAAVHHAVADAHSLAVFVEELSAHYARFTGEGGGPAPAPPAPYAEYASRSRTTPADKLERAIRTFGEELRTPPAVVSSGASGTARAGAGATFRATLDAELRASIERYASARNLPRFVPLLAAFALVRCRFDDTPESLIGIPAADRRRASFERTIGCFVNTIPVRAGVAGDPAFEVFVKRVARTLGVALAHADVPFGAVAQRLPRWVRAGRAALFETLFVLHEEPVPVPRFGGALVEPLRLDLDAVNARLACTIQPEDAGFAVELRYDAGAFDHATIASFFAAFACALERACDAPETAVSRIPLLTPAQARYAARFDDGRTRPLEHRFVADAVEAAERRDPERTAIECGGERLTYDELRAQAGALARALYRATGGEGARVAILVERSAALPVAVLAALRAGCAFVPLDPRHPLPHLRSVVTTIGVDCVLHSPALAARAREVAPGLPALSSAARFAELDGGELRGPRSEESPAYVIATSGSTGVPKGVAIPHAALANVVAAIARRPGFDASHTMLAVTTIAFDIALLELLMPLAAGGRVVVATDDEAADPWALAALLARCAPTHVQATPSLFRALIAAGWEDAGGLRVMAGGEALAPALAAQLLQRGAALYDVYGPTETAIWSTVAHIGDPAAITVGEPIDNTRVYVLDRHGAIVPFGGRGEIAIAGRGVAIGYVGAPPSASERFVRDPFAPHGGRMFLTGDRGSRLPDGRIVLYGRDDEQVKIRGVRVDLGDVDAQLSALPGVRAAAASLGVRSGDPVLVGHLVTAEPFDPANLIAALRARVPAHMVPAALVRCESLPMTASGKIDRRALRDHDVASERGSESAPPSGELETRLAALFADVLEVREVGRDDDLLDVGGNSIDAVRILARVRAEWGVEIPLSVMLTGASSVASIAAEIRRRESERAGDTLGALLDEVERMSEDDATDALAAGGTGP